MAAWLSLAEALVVSPARTLGPAIRGEGLQQRKYTRPDQVWGGGAARVIIILSGSRIVPRGTCRARTASDVAPLDQPSIEATWPTTISIVEPVCGPSTGLSRATARSPPRGAHRSADPDRLQAHELLETVTTAFLAVSARLEPAGDAGSETRGSLRVCPATPPPGFSFGGHGFSW